MTPHAPATVPRPARRHLRTAAACALPCTIALGTLDAQQSPRDTAQRMEGVRVTAGVAPRVAGGASAVVVRPDSIPLLGAAPSLAETIRRLPFVYIRQNSRGENEISVRGSESRQAAVFVEGVPMTLTWDARTDPTIIPMTGAQRVEYVRGLSSLLSGPNAIGGTIAVSLWDPDQRGAAATTRRIDLQADQFGGLRTTGLVGGTLAQGARGTLQFRTGASWRTTPGTVRPGDVREPNTTDALRRNSDARSLDGFAGIRYETGRGRYVSGIVSAMTGERGVVPELHVAQPRLWRNPDLSRVVASVAMGSGTITSRLGKGDIELAVGMNAGETVIDAYASTLYTRVTDRETGDDRSLTARLVWDQQLGRFLTWRGAATGASIRYDETLGLATPVSARYEQRLTSVASELEFAPVRTLTFVGGITEDAVTTPLAGGRTPQERQSGTGWRGGATWFLPMQGLRLHASASERSRFPALRELYSGALARFAPNPALRPERFRGAELGATVQRAAWDLQVVGFRQRTTDAVVRVTLPDRRFQRINRDEFRAHGVELLGGTTLGRVQLRGDLTWQDATIRDRTADGAERIPENLPTTFGSLQATAPAWRGVLGTARVRHVSSTSCLGVQPGTRVVQEGATALDVGAERGWTLAGVTRRLRAMVMLDNVLDAAVYDQCGLPQPGRTLRIGVSMGS
jgi:iron complex outermembrane receptor protein